jgi:asparagine synthase (glutamine-hydrolysing)
MCGFVTFLQDGPRIGLDTAKRCLGSIAHRGPDAEGEWCEDSLYLGHRRLSIIDLASGQQPMQSMDGRYVIVFNGEIYNFLELRESLISAGGSFRTRSDTEVILEGYRIWGADVVNKLHGMFSFVIWDRARRTAFGARDRLGIKPLCWAMYQGALIASSTLEPFGRLDQFRDIDATALRDLMAFDYIPSPRTIFRGVHKLEPGRRFVWELGSAEPKIDRYWGPPMADETLRTVDESEIESLLSQAVKSQMISDVPIGAFLSGGIDSSLLVAFMARHSNRPVRTFSVAFKEEKADESRIAKLVAERFGTDHQVLYAEDLKADALLKLLASLDEPFCDDALVPTYSLSQLTREHVKVALSGDGGDEVFGGYPKYLLGETGNGSRRSVSGGLLHRGLEAVPWRPRGVGRIYPRLLGSQDRIRYAWTRYGNFPVFRKDMRQLFVRDFFDNMRLEEFFEPWERRASRYGKVFNSDLLMRTDLETYLSENCLVKTDRASMLASLEVRVPYLHETVLDRILPLPADKKILGGRLKSLLLPLAQRLLPKQVWDRPKQGFDVVVDARMAGGWKPAIEAALDWGEANARLFHYPYLRRLHAINLAGGGIGRELWNPFVFLAWAMSRSVRM